MNECSRPTLCTTLNISVFFFLSSFAVSAPPTPKWFISNPWRKNFQKKKTTDFNWLLFGRNTYKFDGKTGTEPSDGGKGGHGGIGGNAGKCPLVCFDIQPKFVISKNKGRYIYIDRKITFLSCSNCN